VRITTGIMEEIKDIILDFATHNSKSKFYFNDMLKAVRKKKADASIDDVKTAASTLVNDAILDFFSRGSTSMYMLKER
jgi:dissimilatory sulfite reductase D (DsrD)